jgi:hypothetical protein
MLRIFKNYLYILNDQGEQEKFDNYSGGNFLIEYTRNGNNMLVKQIQVEQSGPETTGSG